MRRMLVLFFVMSLATSAVPGPAFAAPKQATVLVARAHFGFGRSRSTVRSGSRFRRPRVHLPRLRTRGLLRRIVAALAFAAILHFLLHSLGGILVLIVVVMLLVMLVRAFSRRRRRPMY